MNVSRFSATLRRRSEKGDFHETCVEWYGRAESEICLCPGESYCSLSSWLDDKVVGSWVVCVGMRSTVFGDGETENWKIGFLVVGRSAGRVIEGEVCIAAGCSTRGHEPLLNAQGTECKVNKFKGGVGAEGVGSKVG